MAEYKVTSSELRAKAAELNGYISQFSTEMGNLVSTESTLATTDEGDAQRAFHNNFTTLHSEMETFKTVMQDYVTQLEVAAQGYEAAEQQAITIAQSK